ncbi:putative methyltransferase-domain-containing protein [Pelagophyceae sp. CCMP2097]|nr:putative methyltransferase-domain-containing protein [Pelagophyceae sp. CCMP2097]
MRAPRLLLVWAATADALAGSVQAKGLRGLQVPSHGLSPLPHGSLDIDAPGWGRGYGTGAQVWPAAASLARWVAANVAPAEDASLEDRLVVKPAADRPVEENGIPLLRNSSVLELGSGTGALGLWVGAALGAGRVTLTDKALKSLRQGNIERNRHLFPNSADVRDVDFAFGDDTSDIRGHDVILASDVTYDDAAHAALVRTLAELLADGAPLALLAHQHRPVASVLGGRSVLRHFEAAAAAGGLSLETVWTEAPFGDFGRIDVMRISLARTIIT